MRRKFEGSDLTDMESQPDWQLCGWVVEQMWQMLREMFAPQSQDPRWKGVSASQFLKAQLGHDVGGPVVQPFGILRCLWRQPHKLHRLRSHPMGAPSAGQLQ